MFKRNYLLFTFCAFIHVVAFSQNIDSLYRLLKTDKEDTLKVLHLNNIASILNSQYYDSAIALNTEALTLAQKLNWSRGIAKSYQMLGIVNDNKGELDLALKYLRQSLDIYKALTAAHPSNVNYKIQLANTLSSLGIIYRNQSDHINALDYLLQSLKLDEELQDAAGVAADYANLGVIYSDIQDLDKALEYELKALAINENLHDEENLMLNFENCGVIYLHKKDYRKAFENFTKALALSEKLDNKYYLAICQGNLGLVFGEQKNPKKALDYFEKALALSSEIGHKPGIITNLGNIGAMHTVAGKFMEAEQELIKALELSEEIRSVDFLMTEHKNLSDLYIAKGEYKKAMEHFKSYILFKDSIYNQKKDKQLGRQEVKYEFEKEKAVKEAEHKNELTLLLKEKQVADYKKYLTLALLLFVVLIGLALFSRQRIKTKKQKEAFEIRQRLDEAELTRSKLEKEKLQMEMDRNIEKLNSYTSAIQEHTKVFDKMQEELEQLKTRNQLLDVNAEQLMNSIKESIDPEVYWEEFMSSFNIVYRNFIEKLTTAYPDLSRSEIRLCILVKCNLGNKEIANVLHISADSVKKSHNRIRKKFNIDPSENLRKFLDQLA